MEPVGPAPPVTAPPADTAPPEDPLTGVVPTAPEPPALEAAFDRVPGVLVPAPELPAPDAAFDRVPGVVVPDETLRGTAAGDLRPVDVVTDGRGGSRGTEPVAGWIDPAMPAAGVGVVDEARGGNPVEDLAREVVEAAGEALAAVARLWADPPSPGIGAVGADGTIDPSAAAQLVVGSLTWYTAALAVVAVLVAAGRMVWQRRGAPVADLLRGLLTLVLVGGAAVTGVTLVVSAADAFSLWVLQQATGDVEAGLTELLAVPQDGASSPVLTVLLGTAVLLGALVQIVLLVARGVVLVVLAGALPLTAAATNTDLGRSVFTRTVAWVLAFVLYQPAAALVYSAGFLLPPASDAPLVGSLTGVTFLALAVATLPALLRLLQPVVRTATAGGRRRGAGGLPTGARVVVPAGSGPAAAPGAALRVPSGRGGGPAGVAVDVPRSRRLRSGAPVEIPALGGPGTPDRLVPAGEGRHRRGSGPRPLPAPRDEERLP
ncbi:hypothetical protein [Geodermatophilus marinus]|uniref:hypothetical protein n=1 Tax=Geodermatophilus sp. LHW52908 TaxID=2303986 RepID=UPI0011C0F14D|nr:hypothetical protein [Geodermatophilus sp. LHW52908]